MTWVVKEYLTLDELVERYKLPSKNWAYQRTRLENGLPGIRRLGRHIRICAAEFEAALEAGEVR